MGLAGRKDKQRIGEDPRNTKWANDTSSPGYKMLAGMGWTPNTVLGGAAARLGMVSGSSTPTTTPGLGLGSVSSSSMGWKRLPTSVLPTAKADTRGLGASLNASALSSFDVGSGAPAFVTAGKGKEELEKAKAARGGGLGDLFARLNKASASNSGASTPVQTEAERGEEDVGKGDKEDKARRKAEKAARKAMRKALKQGGSVDVAVKLDDRTVVVPVPATASAVESTSTPVLNPRMASRARHLASKRLAISSNAAAMAEILGVVAAPASAPTSIPEPAVAVDPSPSSEPSPALVLPLAPAPSAEAEPVNARGESKKRKKEARAHPDQVDSAKTKKPKKRRTELEVADEQATKPEKRKKKKKRSEVAEV